MEPGFTAEERRLIARARLRRGDEPLGWALVLLPLAAFAIYGVWRSDAVAVFVAWAGSFAWLVWWLAASRRAAAAWARILEKYAATEPNRDVERDHGA